MSDCDQPYLYREVTAGYLIGHWEVYYTESGKDRVVIENAPSIGMAHFYTRMLNEAYQRGAESSAERLHQREDIKPKNVKTVKVKVSYGEKLYPTYERD